MVKCVSWGRCFRFWHRFWHHCSWRSRCRCVKWVSTWCAGHALGSSSAGNGGTVSQALQQKKNILQPPRSARRKGLDRREKSCEIHVSVGGHHPAPAGRPEQTAHTLVTRGQSFLLRPLERISSTAALWPSGRLCFHLSPNRTDSLSSPSTSSTATANEIIGAVECASLSNLHYEALLALPERRQRFRQQRPASPWRRHVLLSATPWPLQVALRTPRHALDTRWKVQRGHHSHHQTTHGQEDLSGCIRVGWPFHLFDPVRFLT